MKQGKSVGGLETMAFQLNLLYGYTMEEQKEALQILDWKMAICSSPEETAKMLDNRNADWLTKVLGIMNEKPTLFAVGAGHLLGENGVLNLLCKAGYQVEAVQQRQVIFPILFRLHNHAFWDFTKARLKFMLNSDAIKFKLSCNSA